MNDSMIHFSTIYKRLFFFLVFVAFVLSQSSVTSTSESCAFPNLPTTFQSLSFLDFDQSFHVQGEYRANFSAIREPILFNLTQTSVVRFYTAPHAVDVDLWLYNQSNNAVVARSSLDIGTEEVIFKTLQPGSYRFQFTYFGFWIGKYKAGICDTIQVELAIEPLARVQSRTAAFTCPGSENIPQLDLSSLTNGGASSFFYDSDMNATGTVMNIQSASSTNSRFTRWIQSYNFSVPETDNVNSFWSFHATIGTEFLTAGTIGLLLMPQGNSTPDSRRCLRDGSCVISHRANWNFQSLSTSLIPGDYSLYLYDKSGERDSSLLSCVPFTFTLELFPEEEEETLLTCLARPMPQILLPGFDSPAGYIHFADEVLLDASVRNHKINFTITTQSFFRIRTSPHHIDIDLKLTNADTGRDVEFAFAFGGEEAISASLAPAKYIITILYYGIYDYESCETFFLEVSIAPTSFYDPTFSFCPTSSYLPDLSLLNQALSQSPYSFSLPVNNKNIQDRPYVFLYNNDYSKKVIFSQNFTLNYASNLQAYLGDAFLVGDMEVTLINYDEDNVTPFFGDFLRNHDFLTSTLEPGNYGLQISTASMQKPNLANFPPCSIFTFGLSIQPINSANNSSNNLMKNCWMYERIPGNLNSIEYMNLTGAVHIQQDFLAPLDMKINKWTDRESIYFKTTTASFIRIWTEPNVLDVDFYLYEVGVSTPIAVAVKLGQEEEITAKLKANTNYRLQIIYYYFSRPNLAPNCFIFNFEMAIIPINLDPKPIGCSDLLPSSDFIPDFDDSDPNNLFSQEPFYNSSIFSFTQDYTPLSLFLNFSIGTSDQANVFFRAFVEHSFVWLDLSMKILTLDPEGKILSSFTFSEGTYNEMDTTPILLTRGNYSLQIYEPAVASAEFRRCVSFRLTVTWQNALGPNSSFVDPMFCPNFILPRTLNQLAYLGSPLTGGQVHFKENILADVISRRDQLSFNLNQASQVSIFIGNQGSFASLDVDYTLRKGNDSSPNGEIIASRNGFSEESSLNLLTSGQYIIQFRYYGVRGNILPSIQNCPNFFFEFSVVPLTLLEDPNNNNWSRKNCADLNDQNVNVLSNFPLTLSSNDQMTSMFISRPNSGQNWTPNAIQFEVDQGALLMIELKQYFPLGPLFFTLNGVIQETSVVNKIFRPQSSQNLFFLYRELNQGNYTIQFSDLNNYNQVSRDNNIQCILLEFSYYLNYTIDDNPCADLDFLPTDFYSDQGNSEAFGGPQDSLTGAVRISGDQFSLDDSNGKNNLITFMVPVPSFMRMFAYAPKGNDLDFYVYNNVNRSTGSLVFASVGIDTVETAIVKLNNQTNPFLLNVYFFRVDHKVECPSFSFEFAMKPVEVVKRELQCPPVLPSPEVPSPSITFDRDIYIYNRFVFTSDRIQDNTINKIFTYRITWNVLYNTSIFVSIAFDFLANDFRLVLRQANSDLNDPILQTGSFASLTDITYYNFANEIEAQLSPGLYYLDIVEDLHRKSLGFVEYCHKFNFLVASFVDKPPSIQRVFPPSGNQLDPMRDLRLSIVFSVAISLSPNVTTSIVSYLNNRNSVYLINTAYPNPNSSPKIFPNYARLDRTLTTLELVFPHSGFRTNTTYQLIIDASQFSTSDGTTFSQPTQTYLYSMFDCSCSGHGHCLDNFHANCSCDLGYSGYICSSCDENFHPVGTSCVPNVYCDQNSCNGHGVCSDDLGFVQCDCEDGYASTDQFCNVCAQGYSGYPNCTQNEPDKVPFCPAPLLPNDLKSPGKLGYNGRIHMQDSFYLDTVNFKHDLYFELAVDSLFRVAVSPSWIDVDILLYSLKDDLSIEKVVNRSTTNGNEEVIFSFLPGRNELNPKNYLLRFRYFIFGRKKPSNCETFDLEFAIQPIIDFQNSEATQLNPTCPTKDQLPSIFSSSNNNNGYTIFSPILLSGFSYSTPLNSPNFLISDAKFGTKGPRYVSSFNFSILNYPNQLAVLEAIIGSRFLGGAVSMMLETNSSFVPLDPNNNNYGNPKHCGIKGGADPRCLLGLNRHNRNHLGLELSPGNYTLWLYEPVPQNNSLTKCSPFDFMLNIQYLDSEIEDFLCEFPEFPGNLNVPGFLNSVNQMHVLDRFLLGNGNLVSNFSVSQNSFLRVHGESDEIVSFSLIGLDQQNQNIQLESYYGQHTQLFASLVPGRYNFSILALSLSDPTCPNIELEMQISPDTGPLSNKCTTSGGRDYLPSLPVNFRAPFEFGHTSDSNPVPISFFAYTNNRVVKEYTFVVEEISSFQAFISSDFLTASLGLRLIFPSNSDINSVDSSSSYNRQEIRELLDPGNYKIQILQPLYFSNNKPVHFPSCVEFNFEISFKTAKSIFNSSCDQSGEDLPRSLNSIRFLGPDNHFLFQSDAIRVPSFDGFFSQNLYFNVSTNSLFRIYTEPHVVDIDIALYQQGNPRALATGGYTFNDEESIVYSLDPNVNYFVQFIFWKWTNKIPQCPQFGLEISISPIIAPIIPSCPNSGGDHWFPGFNLNSDNSIKTPYFYSSINQNETLFFQQRNNEKRQSPWFNFTVNPNPVNLRIFVGSEFLTGDLIIELYDQNKKTSYFGTHTMNGNLLLLSNLAVGSYALNIHEAVTNLMEFQGCVYFVAEIEVEDDLEINEMALPWELDYLPASLNRVAYLPYAGRVHLDGYYPMFSSDSPNSESITFNINQQSFLRATTSHYVEDLNEVQINIYSMPGKNIYSSYVESCFELLPAGNYLLELKRPLGASRTGLVFVNFQLLIEPFSVVSNDINSPLNHPSFDQNCPDKLLPNSISQNSNIQNGFFFFHSDELTFSKVSISSQTLLQQISLVLTETSKVYLRLGFPYVLVDPFVVLNGTSDFGGNFAQVFGDFSRNQIELNTVLSSGLYNLFISQRNLFDFVGTLPHCTPFSAYLSIVPIDDSNNNPGDCSYLDIVPWDLMQPNGGSLPFGGPVNPASGSLQISGDKFIIPPSPGSKDIMTFQVKTSSLFAVFIKPSPQNPNSFGPVTPALLQFQSTFSDNNPSSFYQNQNGSLVSSIYSFNNRWFGQSQALFTLPGPENGGKNITPYQVVLNYNPPKRVACPSYSMSVSMKPINSLVRNIICPLNSQSKMPNPLIVQDPNSQNGFYSEYIDSFFTDAFRRNRTDSKGTFFYEIQINITQKSHFVFSFSYHSLLNGYQVILLGRNRNSDMKYEIGRSQWSFGKNQISENLNQNLFANLNPGTYFVQIKENVFPLPFLTPTNVRYCFPYVYDLQIFPDNGYPYISEVDPVGGRGLNPDSVVEISVTLSSNVYDNNGKLITNNDPSTIIQSFGLISSYSTSYLSPRYVYTSNNPKDNSNWVLTFPGPFDSADRLRLFLRPASLFDSTGKPFTHVMTNYYVMLKKNCSGNGDFDQGICFCKNGYAGIECETCDINYVNINPDPLGTPICKEKTGTQCLIDTCGCDPKNTQVCIPLGICDDSSGTPVCKCPRNYGGDHCERCAVGFHSYNDGCLVDCNCVRGECNANGMCVCPPNFSGATCNECASGWSGSDCSVQIQGDGPVISDDALKTLNAFKIIGIILTVISLLASSAWLLYRRFGYKPSYVKLDGLVDDAFDNTELNEKEELTLDTKLDDI